jgi:hypothetical protein
MPFQCYVRGGGEGKRRILIGQSVPPTPFGMVFGRRVANLWVFPLKTQIWGFFWPLGNQGIFRGILKVSYNRAFSVKYGKNMSISAPQNMFCPIFLVIYHKIYTYCILRRICRILGEFIYFWGILGDF